MPAPHIRLAALCLLLAAGMARAESAKLAAEGTAFRLTLPEGRVLGSHALVGAVIAFETGEGKRDLRIDAVEADPRDAEILLHRLSVKGADGTWGEFCQPDPEGRRLGFPLAGRARPDGTLASEPGGIALVCTSGAAGKCARFGYKPWKTAPGGGALLDYFNACVRMLRADYCGDGAAATRDGTLVDLYDRARIQTPDDDPAMEFEAAWSAEGAVCVRRTRIPSLLTLERLAAVCPRLRDRLGAACDEAAGMREGALLFNRSRP